MRRGSLIACGMVAAALALQSTGCWVPPWEDASHDLCDPDHGCVAGKICFKNQCVPECDGGPCLDAGDTGACTVAGAPCDGGICRSDMACVAAGSEFNCTNGVDDNGNSLSDCDDPDCAGVECSASACSAAKCQMGGACVGPPVTCAAPGVCHWPATPACDADAGCQYIVDAGASCNDGDLCTLTDRCTALGGCAGTPKSCSPPPIACASPTGCNPANGQCTYAVNLSNSCTDNNACTHTDHCLADGGCTGTSYTCTSTQCMQRSCLGDGNCSSTPLTGQGCPGGTCTDAGTCQPTSASFPYTPANFNAGLIQSGGLGGNLTLSCPATYNTTTLSGSWCGQPPPTVTVTGQTTGGPNVAVFAMSGLNITAGGSLTITGSKPAILVVFGDATIAGPLSAASSTVASGAGAESYGCSTAGTGTQSSSSKGSGGGGGGYGLDGGRGGDTTEGSGAAGGGGGGFNGTTTLAPLRGGCNGGLGGQGKGSGGAEGLGGGGLQVSASGQLTVSGTVTASGGGGGRGTCEDCGGGGGGSGGAVLLEGNDVDVTSTANLTANGGGGGAGASASSGSSGVNGSTTTGAQAAGGSGGAGAGGLGGASAGGAGAGGSANDGAGGGGGAVGRIRVRGASTCLINASAVKSPAHSPAGVCP